VITDEELADHPDPRVDPGICGIVATHTAAGVPLTIERICILPPHDDGLRREHRPSLGSGYYPRAERHHFVTRYPNREVLDT
jgi:hypothetical protein